METPLREYLLPNPKLRLREQVREVARFRHLSLRTEQAYWDWIRRYIIFHGRKHPRDLAESEVRAFLVHLATERRVAASTQNQALNALVFLYRQNGVSPAHLYKPEFIRFVHLLGWHFEAGLRHARRSRSSMVRLFTSRLRPAAFSFRPGKQAFVNHPFCSVLNVRDCPLYQARAWLGVWSVGVMWQQRWTV